MAISNELSSDVAAAILSTRRNSPLSLEDLKRIVLQVHETLERLAAENRRARRKIRVAGASGTHVPKLD